LNASFLLDESAPTSVLKVLKKRGFEAIRLIDIGFIGVKNSEIAELSIRENRIIVTLDSDFLRLRKSLLRKVKVIFINVHPRDPLMIAHLVDERVNECIKILKRKNVITLTKEGITT